jgi:hypothetical protein
MYRVLGIDVRRREVRDIADGGERAGQVGSDAVFLLPVHRDAAHREVGAGLLDARHGGKGGLYCPDAGRGMHGGNRKHALPPPAT